MRALLLLALLTPGCVDLSPDRHWVHSVVATASYENGYDLARVADAARALGWTVSNGTGPGGTGPALVLEHEETLYAREDARIEAHYELAQDARVRRGESSEAVAQREGEAFRDRFVAALSPLEREARLSRTNVTFRSAIAVVEIRD